MSKTDFENGFALGLVSGGVVEVADTTEIDNLENLIDESGVLDSTEGSVEDKVGQLIDKVKSGSSPSIDENGIVSFGENTSVDENGIVSL
jgi:hypothetical protein